METCVVNLIEPGDKMLVCVNGVFGGRMADVAGRAGAQVTTIERPFGEVFSADQIAEAVARVKPKVVGIVHAETSTGAHQPLAEISKVVHDGGALLLADTVTSLGGTPVEVDAWQLDAVYSGTQKCLSCPPGLAPVTFSPRAVAAIDARKTKVAVLVSRHDDGSQLLGPGSGVSPYGPDQHELRSARGAGRRARRGA